SPLFPSPTLSRSFGPRVLGELERAVRNDNPRRASDGHVRAGIGVDETLGGRDGGAVVLHLIHVIGRRTQDRRGMLVVRKCVGKFERACNRIALDGLLLVL